MAAQDWSWGGGRAGLAAMTPGGSLASGMQTIQLPNGGGAVTVNLAAGTGSGPFGNFTFTPGTSLADIQQGVFAVWGVSSSNPHAGAAPGAPGGSGSSGSGSGAGGSSDPAVQNALDAVRTVAPWVDQIGLLDQIRQWATQGMSPESMVLNLRNTQQWKNRFKFIRRADGTLRMSEGEYFRREQDYRQVGAEFGKTYADPSDFGGLFENEVDPNEFRDRLKIYSQLESGTEEERSAFYVYAGMKVSTDDLYQAAVDPQAAADLAQTYNQRIAAAHLDWDTWIQRATEAGLDRVARTLTRLEEQGVSTGVAITQVGAVDPAFSRQLMESLYVGDGTGGKRLALNELMNAFEYAMLGSAASGQGLALPDAQRLELFRQAGVQRAQALEAYGKYAQNKGVFEGAVQRAGLGSSFSQADYEDAAFLHQADPTARLERALSFEQSLGKAGGSFAFGRNQAGMIVQSGLSNPRT